MTTKSATKNSAADALSGILLFDKPIGWTSHDAVDFVRRRAGQKKVGHAGTLDPMATGLLVLLLGSATKRSTSLAGLDKEYAGTIALGLVTDTQDLEGRLSVRSCEDLSELAVRAAFASLEGERLQTPPAFSALKRGGKKLCDVARKGGVLTAEPRPVTVKRFDFLGLNGDEAHFHLECSKGTYVRAIASELGDALGCGAALSSLVRLRVGPYLLHGAAREGDLAGGRAAVAARLLPPGA